MSKTSIELLSPARNLECGIAAIDHGADAVYIGAPRFGARAAAGNTVDDIARLCQYAHPFGVRIYATGKNLLTLTKFSGVDPATYQVNGLTPGAQGSRTYFPSTRQFIVGLQVDF